MARARWNPILLLLAGLAALWGAPSPVQAAPPVLAYRLAETWSDASWTLRPGHYRDAVDIASMPDGTLYVLDARSAGQLNYPAVHRLGADGRAVAVVRLPGSSYNLAPTRMDIGPDGHLWVLWTNRGRGRGRARPQTQLTEIRLDEAPLRAQSVSQVSFAEDYRDVAVDRSGQVYLARHAESAFLGVAAVDVYRDGSLDHSITAPELALPYAVDVAADDTVYVLHEIPPPPSEGGGGGGGGPRPDPGPSAAEPPRPAGILADPVTGVAIFDAAHRWLETVPFDFGIDVATGPAGTFVARYGQVFALRETEPLTPLMGQRWTGELALEVPAGGGLYGSLSHCAFEGSIAFREPARRPAPTSLDGAMDHPALEGPAHPLRAAAGARLALLQGRFGPGPAEADGSLRDLEPNGPEPQNVQDWSLEGQLSGQMGVCAQTFPSGWAHDVALDGDTVYHTVGASCVERRPDAGFAEWTECLDGQWGDGIRTVLGALAADAGKVALLDRGASGVTVLDQAGAVVHRWLLGEGGVGGGVVVDLDLSGDRLALADRGRARVELRNLSGAVIGSWTAHDSPDAVAWGPEGDVYVLGVGGWGLRYSDAGDLKAVWPMPDPDAQALDLAVGDDGRVYVPFIRYNPDGDLIATQGVWVFAPTAGPAPALPPAGDRCQAVPDKTAAPRRVMLGESVGVELRVSGSCPGQAQPLQLMIVYDTSRSMNWGYALAEARQSTLDLLGLFDPQRVEVGAVSFNDQAALVSPLTRDLAALGRKVVALSAVGDTQLSGALGVAIQQLRTADKPPDVRQAILIVTDANPSDDAWARLDQARTLGIAVAAMVFEQGQAADPFFLDVLAQVGGELLLDPAPRQVTAYAASLTTTTENPGLFRELTLTDDIPANMRYVPDSARPPALFDAAANRLTWRLGPVAAADGLRLTYRLTPLEVGDWPTNVQAGTEHVDALGHQGRLVFPIPRVEVVAPSRRAIYLPLAIRERCLSRGRPADLVLVLDSSSSMAEPAKGDQPNGPTKLDAARDAAGAFLRLMQLPGDHASVVSFNEQATLAAALTGDLSALDAALSGLRTATGTRIDRGLQAAATELTTRHRGGALPVVILLTDGLQNGDAAPVREQAAVLKATGALVYTIGLGAEVDAALLREAASSPDRYYGSPSADDLAAIYAQISERLRCE